MGFEHTHTHTHLRYPLRSHFLLGGGASGQSVRVHYFDALDTSREKARGVTDRADSIELWACDSRVLYAYACMLACGRA